jgi:hypothetical protein
MYDESRFPLNRVIAFFGPYISIAAGAIASWLLVHVHLLGLFHLQPDGLSTAIAQGTVFLLTALLTWAGHSKWLTGHQIMLQQGVTAAAAFGGAPGGVAIAVPAAPGPAPASVFDAGPDVASDAGALPPGPDDVHPEPGDADLLQAVTASAPTAVLAPPPPPPDDLPTDEEEFAHPPSAYSYDELPEIPESAQRPDAPEDVI